VPVVSHPTLFAPTVVRAGPFVRLVRCAVLLLALSACSGPQAIELRGSAMGTTWTVTVAPPVADAVLEQARQMIRDVLAETDATLSGWNATSEVVIFNRQSRLDWQPMSEPLYSVLVAARTVSEQSGGAFDVTVAPLVGLWGFGAEAAADRRSPSEGEIAAARALVGSDKLELRPRAARKRLANVRLDLDGIAPGYAVDRISRGLTELGLADHIVEIGGEVRCRGRGPGGRAWRIAVERPQAAAQSVQTVVALEDLAISTSGDYRDFRVLDGEHIQHSIDPRSGRPVTHALASVSVVHESAMYADAYATALMVLGPDPGYSLAERLGLPAFFIVRGNDGFTVRVTPSFARLQVGERGLPHGAHN
jgi:thiamine biosynthesis lipoprotein